MLHRVPERENLLDNALRRPRDHEALEASPRRQLGVRLSGWSRMTSSSPALASFVLITWK